MTTIDRFVADFAAHLRVERRRRTAIVEEVRDHLVDAAEARARRFGEPRDRAEDAAVAAFGSPAVIARRFNAAAGARAMRRAPFLGVIAGAGVVVAFLAAAVPQPRTTQHATPAMQVTLFVGVLAFQVAIVAGVCGAARAGAVWQRSASSAVDRGFVRRCMTVSMLALWVGVLGVTTNFVLDARRAPDVNGIALAAGAVAMISVATAGLVVLVRLDVNAGDDDDVATPTAGEWSALLRAGDSAMRVVNRHPMVSCAAATIAATTWAMFQAEAPSVMAALPWGVGEAVTVVAAFVLLGPTLGLRESRG
jgi:hypothetical protein